MSEVITAIIMVPIFVCTIYIILVSIISNRGYHKPIKKQLINITVDSFIDLCEMTVGFIFHDSESSYSNIKTQLKISLTNYDQNSELLSKDLKDICLKAASICTYTYKKTLDEVVYLTFGDEPPKTPLNKVFELEINELKNLIEQLKNFKRQ